MRDLADRAGLALGTVQRIEAGARSSLDAYAAVAHALGLRLELMLVDDRRRASPTTRPEDPVHAAMGELEARHLRAHGFEVGIDEPYQHFQFAGRADVVAWSRDARALLHVENKTRFPNLGEVAGAWNAKRAYLPGAVATRIGIRRFRGVTHVMVALWSAEVLHALRLHPATFRALAPDPARAFGSWWSGTAPGGTHTTLVLLDPFATGRQHPFIDLETALRPSTRPRVAGYAAAAARIAAGNT